MANWTCIPIQYRVIRALSITMPPRPDISDKVIHFTRGATAAAALESLLTIVVEGRLLGGNGMIRGGYNCVCFTEAPLPALATGLVNSGSFSRYSPFGLMFEKAWLHARGGRPVIYQPDAEFTALPEAMRWRHVRYEPSATPPIDFTWEREWRIRCQELAFASAEAAIVVPDDDAEALIRDIWDQQQELEAESYSTLFEQTIVELMRDAFPWRVVRLS